MELVKYDAACKALAEAKEVDEVKSLRDKAQAISAYAKQAKNKQMEIDAAEIRIRAERRLGEMLKDKDARAKPGEYRKESSLSTLSDMGISRDLSSRSQAMASIPEDEFEAMLSEHREEQKAVTGRTMEKLAKSGHNHRAQGTGENEWYTPPEYIELAQSVMGGIDLDPASSDTAQEYVQAEYYYTTEQDGLEQEWFGRIWLNPPYSQPAIAHFAERFAIAVENEEIDEGIVLTHNYTDTAWFHRLAGVATRLCFTRGRIAFLNQNGEKAQPTQGQAFFYYGTKMSKFKSKFANYGFIR